MTNQKVTGDIDKGVPKREATEPLTPEQFLTEIKATLAELTKAEATRALEHGRTWATVFYGGGVPAELVSELDQLEAQWLS